ncbi:PepSY-associated TM helix domain-containing protein [Pedobacter hartonius]|uniref:Uncharacterized iron-regulated membrane protein n=1 Tax=Pedobacter hartonius TaxID=425514 RepID=A0A1H4GYK2_9SPHI|nr:PepSY-associated TM helix domain-containing protein [Pedobacter hartonius]SEB14637.1 Uncharacterized iron-regulated membrane protein [Pedobacter hartonius]
MTRFRKITGFIHLWLGLISGLVVLVLSITGCIFAFQKEISDVVYSKVLLVKSPSAGAPLPYSVLLGKARQTIGKGREVNYSVSYKDRGRAWEFMTYKGGDEKAFFYFDTIDYYDSVFINPYTGAVTGHIDYKHEFFNIIKMLHWGLLLNDSYGQIITGCSTLIFVIMLITGMIMWWPKKWSKSNINRSFKVKWKAGFKRVNYDLHNVPGFYAMLLTLILALTGLVFAFTWFQQVVYFVASGTSVQPVIKYEKSVSVTPVSSPIDFAFLRAKAMFPTSDRITVGPASGKEGVIFINGIRGKETYYNADILQFDRYTGKLLNRRNYDEQNAGEKLYGMNYDIHVGAILGLPGKILAFIASLIAASLPITGFMIWLGRKKKKKRKS